MNAASKDTARGGDTSQAASSAATSADPGDFAIASAPTTQGPQDSPAEAVPNDANGASEEAQVPSSRLREEASRRREAEATAQQMQAQMQNMQNQLIMQQQLGQLAANNAQQAQAPNPEDQMVTMFGDPEDGAADAYNAVKTVADHAAEQAAAQVAARLQAEMDRKLGGVTASFQTADRLSAMKASGLIDDSAEKTIGQRMSQRIAQDPRWGEPGNQTHLVNDIYMSMLENGEIRPGRRQTPSNAGGMGNTPWQPGGHGQPNAQQQQAAIDAQLQEIQQRFPRRFGTKTLQEMRDMSAEMGFTPQTAAAPAPQQVPTYSQQPTQHTEGMPGSPRTFTHTR